MAAPFVDTAKITVRAGNGGNGAVAFHREKYIANGGPEAAATAARAAASSWCPTAACPPDGFPLQAEVRGGKRRRRLRQPQNRPRTAGSGHPGPRGHRGPGPESGQIIQDMSGCDRYVLARAAKGGWGNQHFATPTRQAPGSPRPGSPGQAMEVTLELKLLADVGLVGFPNVGKSTLLSVVSKAHPKIANYHFTTLMPNLGVVYVDEGSSFVMADIPGIIEGASGGAGLGYDFLRHIDRCRLLVHLVDVSGSEGRDPVADFDAINTELKEYSPELAQRPMIVCGNKADLLFDRAPVEALKAHAEALGYPLLRALRRHPSGVQPLIHEIAARLAALPPVKVYEPDYVPKRPEIDTSGEVSIEVDDHHWFVDAPWLEHLLACTNLDDFESRNWFDKQLRASGLFEKMEAMGGPGRGHRGPVRPAI